MAFATDTFLDEKLFTALAFATVILSDEKLFVAPWICSGDHLGLTAVHYVDICNTDLLG